MNDHHRWEDYFWPDAPDVLRNKLGIRDQRMLNFVEAQFSAVRIYEQGLESLRFRIATVELIGGVEKRQIKVVPYDPA